MIRLLALSVLGLSTILGGPITNTFNSVKAATPEIKEAVTSSNYYESLDESKEGRAFRSDLAKLITDTHKNKTTYDGLSNVFKTADADPKKSGNVLWWYSGTSVSFSGFGGSVGQTNREHVWPKHGGDAFPEKTGPGCDGHHLRPAECQLNSTRGECGFDEIPQNTSNLVTQGGSTTYGNLCYKSGNLFYPGVGYRGATARILMYVQVRWGDAYNLEFVDNQAQASSTKKMGVISTLMKWHLQEPIQEFEVRRNEAVFNIQGNRNPFIDHPEYAEKIFCHDGESYNAALQNVVATYGNYTKPDLESLSISPSTASIAVDEERTLNVLATPTNADKSVTWTSSDESIATVSNGIVKGKAKGTVTITATSKTNTSIYATAQISVKEVTGITVTGTPNKTSYYDSQLFDPEGLTIKATYSDGSSGTISTNDCTFTDGVTGKKTLSTGTTSVIVDYVGFKETISGITVEKMPETLSYDVVFQTYTSDGSSTLSTSDLFSNDYIKSGKEYISSITTAKKIYQGTKGLKLGSSSSDGVIQLSINKSLVLNNAVVELQVYSYSGAASVKVNDLPGTVANNSKLQILTYNLKDVETLNIVAEQRIYLAGISLKMAATEENVPVTGVKIGDDQKIKVGESIKLTPTVYPSNASNTSYTFKNNDEKIVTLYSDGTVIGVGVGTATITVTTEDGDYSDSCKIYVEEATPAISVTSVDFLVDSIELYPNDTYTFIATISPTNATNQNVIYEIANTAVATVDDEGKVTAKAIGTTTLTVKSAENNTITDTATIVVKEKPADVHVTGIVLSSTRIEMFEGRQYTLTFEINPSNATNKDVIFSSSDEGVATVDEFGTIKALLEGTTIITVTSKDNAQIKATCEIVVNKIVPPSKQGASTALIVGLSVGIPAIIGAAILTVLLHLKFRKKTLFKNK